MGILVNEDSTLFREFFSEMAALRGISVDYIYPVDEDVEIHGQIFPHFSSIFNINVVFDSTPKVKTLKNYGWFSENSDDKPYIIYFPYDTPHIQTKARIKLYPIGCEKDGKWFEITDISQAIEYPDTYACRVAPVFITDTPKLDYEQTNNNYIDGDNQSDEPTNHIKEINKDLENHIKEVNEQTQFENENFTYLKL